MAGYLGAIPVPQATQHRESFTATSGQTTFNTAGYTVGFLDVYLNGSHLSPADFTATNGSDVVLASGASADDVCDIISYTAFEVANQTFTGTTTMDVAAITGVLTTTAATVFNGGFAANDGSTITTGDNTAQLTLISTDADANDGPLLVLNRNSSSPADNDKVGQIQFLGEDDASNSTIFGSIVNQIKDASNGTEDGRMSFNLISAGSDRTFFNLTHDGTQAEIVVNEDSQDMDFRVESDASANALFVEGSSGNVGIGTSSPSDDVEINTSADAKGLTIKNAGNNRPYLNLDANRSGAGNNLAHLNFKWNGTDVARIIAVAGSDTTNKDDGHIAFQTASAGSADERMRIDSSGHVLINNTAYSANGTLVVQQTADSKGIAIIDSAEANTFFLENDGTINKIRNNSTVPIAFETNSTERMRIDSSGNIFFGATSASAPSYYFAPDSGGGSFKSIKNSTNARTAFEFHNPNGTIGSITTSGSATAYNTSSDYRLKTNAQPMTGASDRVLALNPVNFEWIADGTRVDGFLAHEAQAVVPECVTGTKDAMMDEEYQVSAATGDIYTAATDEADEVIHSADAEQPETLEDGQQWRETTPAVMGTRSVPDMQGIDQSKLVPLLVASLQEALARITALENA